MSSDRDNITEKSTQRVKCYCDVIDTNPILLKPLSFCGIIQKTYTKNECITCNNTKNIHEK